MSWQCCAPQNRFRRQSASVVSYRREEDLMSLQTKANRFAMAMMVVGALIVVPVRGFAQAGFRNTGDMTFSRVSHAAAPLADGSVLVVSDFSAERYDPVSNAFTFIATLDLAHGVGLTATVLVDGRVLLTGGQVGDNSVA